MKTNLVLVALLSFFGSAISADCSGAKLSFNEMDNGVDNALWNVRAAMCNNNQGYEASALGSQNAWVEFWSTSNAYCWVSHRHHISI